MQKQKSDNGNNTSDSIAFGPGLICILDIDVQGVRSMKQTDLNPNYVFVKPPSIEELEKRLKVPTQRPQI